MLDDSLRQMMNRTVAVREVVPPRGDVGEELGDPVFVQAYVENATQVIAAAGGAPGTQEQHLPVIWVEEEITLDSVVFLNPEDWKKPERGKHPSAVRQYDDPDGGPSHWQVTL